MTEREDAMAAILERAWERNHERVLGRLDRVALALEQLAGGSGGDTSATNEAHVLAGALGTYGRPGSPLLREAELCLSGEGGDAAAIAVGVRALAAELT